MTNTPALKIGLATIIAATLAWVTVHTISTVSVVSAGAKNRRTDTKWEYAFLYLRDGKQVFVKADAESTVNPPLNRLSGDKSRGLRSGERYSADTRSVRSHDVGALNTFGGRGWKAVSVTPIDKGFMVLMKRPY